MDTARMRKDLGYNPKWTTAEAFDDYVRGRGLTPIIDPRWVRSMEKSRGVCGAAMGALELQFNRGWEKVTTWLASQKRKSFRCTRIRAVVRLSDARRRERRVRADIRRCCPIPEPGVGRAAGRRRPRDRRAAQFRGRRPISPTRAPTNWRSGSPRWPSSSASGWPATTPSTSSASIEHLNEAIFLPLLRGLFKHWFRVEVSGIENLPAEGAGLVVANHAGVLPFDGLMASVAVHDEHPANATCGCSPPTWSSTCP